MSTNYFEISGEIHVLGSPELKKIKNKVCLSVFMQRWGETIVAIFNWPGFISAHLTGLWGSYKIYSSLFYDNACCLPMILLSINRYKFAENSFTFYKTKLCRSSSSPLLCPPHTQKVSGSIPGDVTCDVI